MQNPKRLVDARVIWLCALAIALAVGAALVARGLTRLIGLFTNLFYYGRFSSEFVSPADHHLGLVAILVPVAGGLVIGVMARFGSRAIRGHGIPEAMEQVLTNESRIPARMTLLKPLSAALAIGSGGPFGAEGPIIATGGALGSLVGQILSTTADERKTLLAAGAAAGMAATFGSPVSAVLLAVELLLFEYRARSLIPVALAAATATGARFVLVGSAPVFAMPAVPAPGGGALAAYVVIGALVGVVAVVVTRAVYRVEDAFEKLPLHWMWWPALGGLAIGVCGVFSPRTLGVGYDNIEHVIDGSLAGAALASLCAFKFISWSIALGSGTSGGTLAPLFTLGGGAGSLLGLAAARLLPSAGIDLRLAGLVGMAAMFSGAARALLASVVFAFETTLQPVTLLPLLGGGAAAFLISALIMETSIMTEKIARRGVRVLGEYSADYLDTRAVGLHMSTEIVSVCAGDSLAHVRGWLSGGGVRASHQGFPVLESDGRLVGVLTRRDLLGLEHDEHKPLRALVHRAPVTIFEDASLRHAADQMALHGVGRLPVVRRAAPERVVGMITRSDLITAHMARLTATARRADPRIADPMRRLRSSAKS